MSSYKLGIMKGDGIGPEIVGACTLVLNHLIAINPDIDMELLELPMGLSAIQSHGSSMPKFTKDALQACDGWIMGPHDSLSYPPQMLLQRNPSGELRHEFDLYANIRPISNMPGVPAKCANIDLVVVRENTEGFYPDRNMAVGDGEFMPTGDMAICMGVFTRRAAERIARAAFELATIRRKRVTVVHKSNVIKLSYGLFLETCKAVAKDYPDVQVDDFLVDAMTAHLVNRPQHFDVIVTTNMFGDILSDLTAALAGGLGIAPSLNAGEGMAMAQAVHGSAPDIAGRGIANPTAMLLSAALLLEWLGNQRNDPWLNKMSRQMHLAVIRVYEAGIRTPDLGGDKTTFGFAEEVIRHIQ